MSHSVAKLGDVCLKITDGSHNPPKGVDFSSYLMLSSKNIYDDKLTYDSPRYLSKLDFEVENKRTEVSNGDVLLTIVGTIGRCAIAPAEVKNICLQRSVAVLKPNPTKILSRFLMYSLMSMSDYLNSRARGVAQKGIYLETIRSLNVPLPSLTTQQKIVEKLDAIFAEIDRATMATEANVKNAEALFQSYLIEVFESGGEDWIERKLVDISSYMGRGKSKHRPRNDPSLYGGNYPFIQTGDVRNSDKFITSYTQTYNEKGLAQSKLWKANTVCITIAANIAEIGVLGFDACFPDSVIGIVVDKEKVSEDFLYLMLLFAQQRIKDKSKGSAQENINLGTFEDMFFKVAPLSEQSIIVDKFNDLKSSIDSIRDSNLLKLKELTSIRNSILKQAFSGELVKE